MATGQYLISRIRQELNEIDTSKISDDQLYELLTETQDDLLARVRPESKTVITLNVGQEKYDFDQSKVLVHAILPSWAGTITVVPNGIWKDVQMATSQSVSLPNQITFFGKHMYVAPIPSTGSMPTVSQSIEFWSHRISSANGIDGFNDSIVPQEFNRALIYGTCASFNPIKYIPMYEAEITNKAVLPFLKSSLEITQATW